MNELIGTVTITTTPPNSGWGFLGGQVLSFDIYQTAWVDTGCWGGGGGGVGSYGGFAYDAAPSAASIDTSNVPAEPPPGVSQEDYASLTPAERKLLHRLKYLQRLGDLIDARSFAETESQNYWGGLGAVDGPQDAYRHALWQCRLTQLFNVADAKEWGDAHESLWEKPRSNMMDLHNNEVGRHVATTIGTGGSCLSGVSSAQTTLMLTPPEPAPSAPPGS